MKPGNPRHNFSNRSWAGDSGLAVIQWIGLGAVTLVAAVAIITVFVAGGGGQVHMTVKISVPLVLSEWVGGGNGFPITFHATMRKEMCTY